MTSRRSFFSRIARAVAIVALAPQIAFRAPKPSFGEFKVTLEKIDTNYRCVMVEPLEHYSLSSETFAATYFAPGTTVIIENFSEVPA